MGQLSTNKPFETEVRFFVDDINQFRKTVNHLGGILLREYSFTDYYYQPANEKWDLNEKSIRIREWREPNLQTAVWFTKQEVINIDGFGFKRSLYPEGKIKLFEGDLKLCKDILLDLGFIPLFSINKKHGWVWEVKSQHLEFCVEEVENLGWSGEIELDGTDIEAIKADIKRHQIALNLLDSQLSSKPLASIFQVRKTK